MHGELLRPMLFVGCLVREWELQCRMLLRPWHGAVSVLWMEIGNREWRLWSSKIHARRDAMSGFLFVLP